MRSPQVEAATGLPATVTIYEVGPRDGLQNEKAIVPAATKVEFIRRLEAAGLGTIETTSFVPARWVPQMGDAEEVLAGLGPDGRGRQRPALVPNERGLDRAEELGLRAIAIFGSATETFAQKNLNRSVTEQFAMFAPVVERALADDMWVRAYVSMCFGDPWEGPVPIAQDVYSDERIMDL
jgi:hydroxymethylglutaryl-CoA lyase